LFNGATKAKQERINDTPAKKKSRNQSRIENEAKDLGI
jgi:hypothetical protein